MNKWHYFNENDENCFLEVGMHKKKKLFYTACGMPVGDIKRHTEDKSQVNCLMCLRKLTNNIKGMPPRRRYETRHLHQPNLQ